MSSTRLPATPCLKTTSASTPSTCADLTPCVVSPPGRLSEWNQPVGGATCERDWAPSMNASINPRIGRVRRDVVSYRVIVYRTVGEFDLVRSVVVYGDRG